MTHQRASSCPECGADGRFGACVELFHALLALDHERRQPWGQYHGLNVACYRLQHAATGGADLGASWELVTLFVEQGLDEVIKREAWWVRRNRARARPVHDPVAPPPRTAAATVTIADVALDGSFPAAGYEQRMRAWAESVIHERPPTAM